MQEVSAGHRQLGVQESLTLAQANTCFLVVECLKPMALDFGLLEVQRHMRTHKRHLISLTNMCAGLAKVR